MVPIKRAKASDGFFIGAAVNDHDLIRRPFLGRKSAETT
jgi:hypothetical protein